MLTTCVYNNVSNTCNQILQSCQLSKETVRLSNGSYVKIVVNVAASFSASVVSVQERPGGRGQE